MPEVLRSVLVPIHPAGWPFIILFAIATLIGGAFWEPVFYTGGVLTLWCVYFFRNPDRVTPTRDGLIVSPADGVVQMITEAVPPAELEMPIESLTRVSIFMNVFDVHVNRIPVDGRIAALGYRPGKFFNASLDKASEENEQQAVRIRTEGGAEIAMVQIAGLIARRILCELEVGQPVRAGWRFGMIRFGSRVDVYLPKGEVPQVVVGQTAIAGETILADMQASEPPRRGETR